VKRVISNLGNLAMNYLLAMAFALALALFTAGAAVPPPGVADSATDPETRAHAFMALDPPDWESAREAFQEAAEAGSPTAMSHLGWIYEQGHGVPQDGGKAAEWYARAARAGAHQFAIKLGWMYLGGDGVARDRAQAEFWFARAIEAGHAPARIAWASVLIADAQGGREPERVSEARELLVTALDEGYPLAAFFLARLYIEGIGGHPVDAERAAHYTRIGAEDGNSQLQGWLAFMYFEGRGVARDLVTAAMWANLAAAAEDSLGQQLLPVIEEELLPAQIQEARQRAAAWALERR
jgi:uncharacterized protein